MQKEKSSGVVKTAVHGEKKTNFLRRLIEKTTGVKIGDLGLARSISTTRLNLKSYSGTINYMSPEIHLGKEYSLNSDVWSAGCVIYELIQLKSLFSKENISEIENNVEISNLKFLKINYRVF